MTAPYSSSRFAYEGTETTETSIVRTGGAEDPSGQAQSRKIVTSANAQWLRPFRCAPWAIWNETTGADVTVTVYGLSVESSLPLNSEVWLDAEYQGDASSTLGTIKTTTMANVLATGASVASDSSTWGGLTTVTTFDGVASSVTLSNGDLTATYVLALSGGARSTHNKSSGSWYFEITPGALYSGVFDGVGLITPAGSYVDFCDSGLNCATVYRSGNIWANNANSTKTLGSIVGCVVHIAVNLTTRKIWFRKKTIATSVTGDWNGDATHNPATGAGGVTMASSVDFAPAVGFGGTGRASGESATANFGATAFDATPPSGFSAWSTLNPTAFKLVATLSSPQPSRPGLIHVRPKIAKASATFYLDPKIELTPASAAPSATHKSSRYAYEGTETTETSIVRTGGTAHSRKIVTTANSQWLRPYRAEPFAVWNDTVGADVTVTVYGVTDGGLPNNDQAFMDVEYLGDSASTLGSIASTSKLNVLATGVAVASDSSTWATPAPPTWTPASLTGLIGWWDAKVLASLTLTGSNIDAVADQSGAGNNLTWTGAKPTYSATGFNSQPAIMLGGQASGQALANTSFPLGTGNTLTLWWVGNVTASLTGTDNPGVISYVGAGQSVDWSNAASFVVFRNSGSSTAMTLMRTSTSGNFTHTVDANHRYILTINSSGVQTIYVDGVAVTGATAAGNWTSPGVLRIGRSAAAGYWAGPMGEVGIATSYTDATTAAQLDAYLNTKWGLGAVASTWTPFKLTAVLGSATVSTPTAFDPATVSNITLSNNNRTATASGGAMGVRSTEYRTTGKYYFEVTLTSVHGNGDLVGVVLSTGTYTDTYSGYNCVCVNKVAGNIYINDAINGTIGALTSGDIISVAVDLTAHKAYIRKNGGAWNSGDPVAGTGLTMASGAFAPFVVFGGTGSTVGDSMAANFGQSAFAYAVPTGFTGGWAAANLAPQPGQPGLINVRVKAAKSSATFYIDPTPVLT